MTTPRFLTNRHVVCESDLIGMDWTQRSQVIEDAQRTVQWGIGYQIVKALLAQGDSAQVSLQYSVQEKKDGHEVVITYRAVVGEEVKLNLPDEFRPPEFDVLDEHAARWEAQDDVGEEE